jgi:hypothetical protein
MATLDVTGLTALVNLSIDTIAEGDYDFSTLTSLNQVEMGNLTMTSNFVLSNPALQNVNLYNIDFGTFDCNLSGLTASMISLYVAGCSNISSDISLYDHPDLSSVELSDVTFTGTRILDIANSGDGLAISATDTDLYGVQLNNCSVDSLQVGDDVTSRSAAFTSLDILSTTVNSVQLSNTTGLLSVTLTGSFGTITEFSLFDGALDASSVNAILVGFDTAVKSSGSITIVGGNAAPTGAGLTAVSNLQGRGVTVTTN